MVVLVGIRLLMKKRMEYLEKKAEASTDYLLSTKGVVYTYPAKDVWKNLMKVKTFLSAYNNKYGTNTSK